MPQHWRDHAWTGRQLGLFYGFVVGEGLLLLIAAAKGFSREKKFPAGLAWLLLIYCAGNFLYWHVWDVYLRFGFLYPSFGR